MSALGTIFLIYYIFRGSTDVVASDYIRIINYYLEDVSDLHYLLSWEGIVRIPFTFLMRFINVKVFSYTVFFDKIVGTIGLFLFNAVTLNFVLDHLHTKFIRALASILITYISFSLMAWEMILNGTGYAHFITIGLIALTFKAFANVEGSDVKQTLDADQLANAKTKSSLPIFLLLIITSLLFAGSYSVSYLCTIIFFSMIFIIIKLCKREKFYRQMLYIVISVICLLLYFKSNNTGEALIPVGFKDISLPQLLRTEPLFPLKFILKSLASSIIGVETLDYALNFGTINEKFIFLIGFIYLIIILFVIVLLAIKIFNVAHAVRDDENKPIGVSYAIANSDAHAVRDDENKPVGASYASANSVAHAVQNDMAFLIFISMFIISGLANYMLIFLARYKFVVDSYGMTSRYSLQYMFLTIGIVMLLTKLLDEMLISNKKIILMTASILALSFITLGHLTTNTDEIFKSDYRKIIYSIVEDKAKNYKNLSDQDLEDTFEYHRGPEQIRKAFNILESQKLNVFKN